MRSLPASGLVRTFLSSLALIAAAGCGGDSVPAGDDSSGLQIERVQEGDRTVVRNIAGSEWGEPARLVEDLAIGIMEGDPDYMLAQPVGVVAVGDEILVLDAQDHEVKVYGMDGGFRRAFGQQGEGPGEMNNPFGFFVTSDGRVLVRRVEGHGVRRAGQPHRRLPGRRAADLPLFRDPRRPVRQQMDHSR